MNTARPDPLPAGNPLSEVLRVRVLEPYAANARYVHRAVLTQAGDGSSPRAADPSSWIRLDGTCGFEAPCYIAPTGHFNAVEANITYNQLLYLALAEAIRLRLIPALRHWTLEDFFRAQLPDVLIATYHANFRRPLRSHQYDGWFAFVDVLPKSHRRLLLLQTRAGFSGLGGGECSIDATIALVNWQPA
ncbi:MAG: FcoT family thioesterase [Planctomycetota bacterium]